MDIQYEQSYPTPYAASPLLPLLLLSLSSQKNSPNTKTEFLDEYDYIVVGAGSAGSVVASRLSEEPCATVLLLEAGKPPPVLTDIPAIPRSFVDSDIDWKYMTTPQRYTAAAHVERRMTYASGKALGGSSILNAMFYVRGNKKNYDEWAVMGAKGWSYEEVLPYFKKLEDNTDPELLLNGYHSAGGPITASKPAYNSKKKLAVVEAAESEGYTFVDPNGPEQNGFYDFQASYRNGQRCSTAKAYLVPSENRTNLDILTNSTVRKVLIENKEAIGVEFDFANSTHRVKARREVILCAGAVNSAQLLMLSGIGPMSELKRFSIPLVADLPVGLNLQDHPFTSLMFEVDETLPQFDEEIRDEVNILDYINNRRGPLTSSEGIFLLSFLSNSRKGCIPEPDHAVYFVDLVSQHYFQGGLTPEFLEKVLLPITNKSVVSCGSQLLHPKSRGTVSLQSDDPYVPPAIDPNYYADFRDINDVVQGMKACLKIMNNPAMKRIGAKPVDVVIPGCEEFAQDLDLYLRCIVRTVAYTTNHPVGTAKMGNPEDPTTVVDPELRVKGVQKLRVVDASVMPTIPWGNTNIPTIMVAEKASDIIKSTFQCVLIYKSI